MISCLIFFIYTVLAISLCVVAYYVASGQPDEFMKLAGVYLAALTSLLTAVIAYLSARRQQQAAMELEKLKQQLSGSLEALKIRLSAENRACEELLRAMDSYYYGLASLEKGLLNQSQIDQADVTMRSVAYHANRLHDDCQSAFERYWQQANFTQEKAMTLATDDERKQLWKSEARELANLLNVFVDKCKEHHRFAS